MYGLPADTVKGKFRTKTVPYNGINPRYDEEEFLFKKVSKSPHSFCLLSSYCIGVLNSLNIRT